MRDDHIIDIWFRLHDKMLIEGKTPVGARPPSLREACYAETLSHRSATQTDPETIEAFVNGLELGAMTLLREAWKKTR